MKPRCAQPMDDAALMAWWGGELSAPERRSTDLHLLECAWCSSRAELISTLAEEVRGLVRTGRIQAVVTADLVDRMRREGKTVREYRVHPGGSVQCTVSPHDHLLLARLQADLREVGRVDLLIRIDDDPEIKIPDVACRKDGGEVILAVAVDAMLMRPAHTERLRLVALEASGERELGRYTFNHAPWPGRPEA